MGRTFGSNHSTTSRIRHSKCAHNESFGLSRLLTPHTYEKLEASILRPVWAWARPFFSAPATRISPASSSSSVYSRPSLRSTFSTFGFSRAVATMSSTTETTAAAATTVTTAPAVTETAASNGRPKKLHGRAFYESIGSPKHVVAPMVDQSEFVRQYFSLFTYNGPLANISRLGAC